MGAQSSCGLVVLHYTVIVEDFSTAFTVAEIKQSLWSFRFNHTDLKKKKIIHDNNITLSISFTWKQTNDEEQQMKIKLFISWPV